MPLALHIGHVIGNLHNLCYYWHMRACHGVQDDLPKQAEIPIQMAVEDTNL